MNASRTIVYLKEGRAYVAEVKDGRARVSSLVAWLSAHPGRNALRSLEPIASGPVVNRDAHERGTRVQRPGLEGMTACG